ncbi:hypothetical protein QCN29_11795 [Streptomyces sp. HNM0663]|uniref:Secreted protein n=1 Tax=Streptomyces chengmaiensis TaxID=3040919 RepID=A0ABT6HNJ1_9ACTN|nr:hypothetical protein [Streptomyces chengmaiensis]MDH2389464.1 hypothetical protein [Streptomyces chengmaiensis]
MNVRRHLALATAAAALGGGLALAPAAQASTAQTAQESGAAAYSCHMTKKNGRWHAGHYSGNTVTPAAGRVTSAGIEAQCILKHVWKQSIAVDGYFGPKSRAAFKPVQRSANSVCNAKLVVDGLPGPKSWPYLRHTGCP